jgi:hypothetical protein
MSLIFLRSGVDRNLQQRDDVSLNNPAHHFDICEAGVGLGGGYEPADGEVGQPTTQLSSGMTGQVYPGPPFCIIRKKHVKNMHFFIKD